MSPRTGRPKAENPLNVNLKVRFDQETNNRLLDYCEKHGVTRTEAIRRGIHLLLEQEK
ncbi:CopG family transcriptional regulator [Intestinibacillus sp. Marseille-P6563]|uniref:CopG family transcriptional regulator n=1 Tax=Intestinibacillus sp. Marseille-P6563 TaxID=2364792 RepID=UPI000F0512BB|nr:CopG family transcriptional regulator [Intestinibacillus sp. Marseille-P6563]